MRPGRRNAILVVLLGGLTISPHGAASDTRCADSMELPVDWQTPGLRHHSLVGTVWDRRTGEQTTPGELARIARATRFVLLGEKHDNADHHLLQAWVLSEIARNGRRPVIAMEMLGMEVTEPLRRHLDLRPTDAAALGRAVDWQRSQWPSWELYRPIAEVALSCGLKIAPAGLSRGDTLRVRRGGITSLPREVRRRIGSDVPLPPSLAEALTAEMKAAHCGLLPVGAAQTMSEIQRAQDGHMAERLVEEGTEEGAVLIAGLGHIRRDRGVPLYLGRHVAAREILTIAFLEVSRGAHEPPPPSDGTGIRRFDLIWFTPRVDERDPCDAFRNFSR